VRTKVPEFRAHDQFLLRPNLPPAFPFSKAIWAQLFDDAARKSAKLSVIGMD